MTKRVRDPRARKTVPGVENREAGTPCIARVNNAISPASFRSLFRSQINDAHGAVDHVVATIDTN